MNNLLKKDFPCSDLAPHHQLKNFNFATIFNKGGPLKRHFPISEEYETWKKE